MPRSTRRAIFGALTIVLLAGCGRTPEENTDPPTTTAAAAPVTSLAPTTGAETAAPDTTVLDTAAPDTSAPDTTAADTTSPEALEKPEVELPDELPTELVVTDIIEGEGAPAETGDTVVVHYVGVRSEDGTEFDNSYDAGQPFPVTLGAGGVIQGWDEGLVGIKQGGRRQLDIPAEMAYGDSGAGEIIKPGDALSFVIDAVAVIPAVDSEDAPDVSVEPAENVDTLVVEELIEGDGEELEFGDTAVAHLVAMRADTGETFYSTWDSGQPEQIPYTEEAEFLPGLIEGLEGMQVGDRWLMTIPYLDAYGAEGYEELGLPPETDMVVVVDLIAIT